jgi:SAM-dependent MidA family methyltransferase
LQEAKSTEDKRKENKISEELESALSVLEELQLFEKSLEQVRRPYSDKIELSKDSTWLQQKIVEVRDNGYSPVIDYGVRVNIESLKEADLLHKAAQRVK